MDVTIRDRKALTAVTPAALSAYARAAGWSRVEPYGDHSDVYANEGWPEIIVPRTARLGDYPGVVSQLIHIFARALEKDELATYRDLLNAERDVIQVRAGHTDTAVPLNTGVELLAGARDMVRAAVCSALGPQPVYRGRPSREATAYLRQVGIGPIEPGSFVVTLLTPVVVPSVLGLESSPNDEDPVLRRITKRLVEALAATRKAIRLTAEGRHDAFIHALESGASANLCEALIKLIEPFGAFDITLTWACTRPMEVPRNVFRFTESDTASLQNAADSFRHGGLRPEIRLEGSVHRLTRAEIGPDGTIVLRAVIDGRRRLVQADLTQSDYEHAIEAHRHKYLVTLLGDLEWTGKQWRLLNGHVISVGGKSLPRGNDDEKPRIADPNRRRLRERIDAPDE